MVRRNSRMSRSLLLVKRGYRVFFSGILIRDGGDEIEVRCSDRWFGSFGRCCFSQ
jgi:hypothetical protein